MNLSNRIDEIVRTHDQHEVYSEAARALEHANTHPFAVAREEVAWIGAALGVALGITAARRSPVVHKVVMADAVAMKDRIG